MAYSKNDPIVWHESEYGMYLESPYKKEFVDEMILEVPHEERRWDDRRRQWWISDLYIDEVDNLLFTHFGKRGDGRY